MMDLKPNTFYIKKPVVSTIPLINEFPDLPLSGSSSSNNTFFAGDVTLSTGDVTSFTLVSGNTKPDLNYGDYNLTGGYIKYFTESLDMGESIDPLSVKLWSVDSDYNLEQGGFTLAQSGTTGTPMGHNIASYYSRPFNPLPNFIETFDDRSATHTVKMGNMFYSGPFVFYDEFIESMNKPRKSGNTSKKSAYLRKMASANITVTRNGERIVPLRGPFSPSNQVPYYMIAKTGKTTTGDLGVIGLAGSHKQDWARIYPDAASGFTDFQGVLGGAAKLVINKQPRDSINIRFMSHTGDAFQGSEKGIEPEMNGLLSTYKISKTIQNPFTADLANSFIYSNVQISSDVGIGGNGNALRIYHEWDYSDNNRAIETSQMGGDNSINPQVFMLGCYDLPVPLVTDVGSARPGDKRTFLPRIDINMNIKQLPPTPLYAETTNKANFCSGSANFTLYPEGTNTQAVADFFFSGSSSAPGGTIPNKDRSESLLRSVAVVFSNYKPLEEHNTLDEFLDYGLSNFYGQSAGSVNVGQTHQGIVGGILFRTFGMQNGDDGGTTSTEPPNFRSNFVYAQPLPVTYNTDLAVTVNPGSTGDSDNSMVTYASGGLVGFQPSATVGSTVGMRRPTKDGSMNVLATAGTRNIRADTTSLTGTPPTYVPNTIELPMGTYFNMSVFIDVLASGSSYTNSMNPYSNFPYTGALAWPNGGNTSSAAMNAGGSSMRVVFSTGEENLPVGPPAAAGATPDIDSNKDLLYLDIPFPNTKNTKYAFTDTDNNALNYLLYPRYMTIWVQNYRWVKGQQGTSRPGPTDDLFFFGDFVQSGSSMQTEVLIDSIGLYDFFPQHGLNNFTATNVDSNGWEIQNTAILSPLKTITSPGDYSGSGFGASEIGVPVAYPQPMNYTQVNPGTYVCLGFDSNTNFPLTTSSVSRGGYLFFNDYYTDDKENQERIVPADMIGLGGYLTTNNATLSGSASQNLQETGHMFVGQTVLKTTTSYIDPIVNGPAKYTVDNNTATANALSLASGTNNTNLSVDGFTQKGFARLNVSGALSTTSGTYTNWGKRENPLVSTKILNVFETNSSLTNMSIEVVDPTIFNPLSTEEEYIIYRPYRNGLLSSANYARSGLKLAGPNSVDGNRITFSTSAQRANDGTTNLLTSATLAELYISPYKYWLNLMFKGDRAHVARGYGQIAMVNETPAVSNITNLTGTTWNESNYTYYSTLTGAAEAGDSSPYMHRWDLENIGDVSLIQTDVDFGHGAATPEDKGLGWVAKQTLVSGTFSTFNLDKYLTSSQVGENNEFILLQQLQDIDTNTTARLIGMDNTTKTNFLDYRPNFYYKYEDEVPKTPTLTVKPAVDLLKENTDLYKITSENMNAVKFEWDETDDDIWYRYLICSTGSINNKYQHARLWMPLNEEPPNQNASVSNMTHTCHNVVSGTSMTITNAGKVTSDINGLCGFAPYFKDTSGAYLELPIGTAGFDFPFTSNGSDSVTEYSVVIHCTPDEGLSDAKYTILHKGSVDNLAALTVLISGANANAPRIQVGVNGTFLTSSPITLDGSPVNIIYTYKKDSEFGPDAQLFVNGTREDYSASMPTLTTTDVKLQIGANNNTNHFKGQIEEIIFYDVELKVPDSATNYLYSTANVADKSGSDIITHTSKLFLFDYHNIRGRTFREVTSSNQVSWETTPV